MFIISILQMRKLRPREAEESASGTRLLDGRAQFYCQPPLRWFVTTSPGPSSPNTVLSLFRVLLGSRTRKRLPYQKDVGQMGQGSKLSWSSDSVFIKKGVLILFHPTRLMSGRHVNVQERVGAQWREKIGEENTLPQQPPETDESSQR